VLSCKAEVNKHSLKYCDRCGLPSTTPLCPHCSTLWIFLHDYDEFTFLCPSCGKRIRIDYDEGEIIRCKECGQKIRREEAPFNPTTKYICRRCGTYFHSPDWLKLHEAYAHDGDQQA
jgi:DNA-directed RNA polymerase subunit RPC12/RpoP